MTGAWFDVYVLENIRARVISVIEEENVFVMYCTRQPFH